MLSLIEDKTISSLKLCSLETGTKKRAQHYGKGDILKEWDVIKNQIRIEEQGSKYQYNITRKNLQHFKIVSVLPLESHAEPWQNIVVTC